VGLFQSCSKSLIYDYLDYEIAFSTALILRLFRVLKVIPCPSIQSAINDTPCTSFRHGIYRRWKKIYLGHRKQGRGAVVKGKSYFIRVFNDSFFAEKFSGFPWYCGHSHFLFPVLVARPTLRVAKKYAFNRTRDKKDRLEQEIKKIEKCFPLISFSWRRQNDYNRAMSF